MTHAKHLAELMGDTRSYGGRGGEGRTRIIIIAPTHQCPYAGCTFQGSDDEVDDHRCEFDMHCDQPQAGSNKKL